jgi:hypothetical protein
MARKIISPAEPKIKNGRRLPMRELHRSESVPESGWMSIARTNPEKVNNPSQVFF